MIKVMVEYRAKKGGDITPTLLKLRTAAMKNPDCPGVEILQNREDFRCFTVIELWESPESWEKWEASEARQGAIREAEKLLEEFPNARTYNAVPLVTWAG